MTQLAAVLIDDAFARHDTGTHPEHPRRHAAVSAAIADLLPGRPESPFGPASDEAILRVHTADHLHGIEALAAAGGAWVDPDTMVGPDSLDTARMAAGAAVAGVDAVLDGAAPRAFALGRPPGHHATAGRAMGFCLLNSVAIAAANARHRGLERVAIVDWDVHHGNGTQVAFYDRPEVLFFSTHRLPFYPDTGSVEEIGRGAGEGYNVNVPLPPRLGDGDYAAVFHELLVPIADAFEPQLVLVSAGFDSHGDDPLGGMGVTAEGFANLCAIVQGIAKRHAGGRLAMILEGGYDLPALAESVHACTRVLAGELPPPPPPPSPRGIEALRSVAAFHRRYWPV
jgi:acetoin utilization deacetylase AcuC-like enzyme